jgi:hypothetical protein
MNKKEYRTKQKKDDEDRATFPALGILGGMEKGKDWWEYFKRAKGISDVK